MSTPRIARRALIIAIAATFPAAYANAPDGALKDTKIEKVDTIEVVGHYDNSVGSSDAASQGTVTAKLIENRPALRPGEILEFVPGVIVTQHSGGGKANQYFLRGFNLDHGTDFATYVAGMPVNMPTHAHGQGYSDLNFLIPELVERINYRKGTYFAEEGDFASAGSARIHLFNTLKQSTAELTLGSFDYRRLLVASSQAIGGGSLLYAVDASHNDGPWLNPDNFRRSNALLRYHHGSEDNGWGLTLMGYDARWDSTDQIPQRAVQSGQLDRFDAIDKSDGGKTSRYSLSFDLKERNAGGLFQANAYLIRSRFNLFSNFTYFLDDPVNGDQFEQAERRTTTGLAASQTWFGKLGGSEMSNTLGIQLRSDRLSPVGLYATKERQRLSTVREDAVRETAAGIYAENSVQWLEKFRTIAGLRYDHYRFKVDSNIEANSGNVRDHTTSPKLSLIFGPWAKTEYFANIGRGFHSNDARGTTISVDPKTGDPADRVTPLVRSTGSELGIRTEIIPGLQSSLALWQLKLDSELLFVGDAGTTEASRPSKRHGVEWSNHYVVNRNLLLDLDLAASRARFRDDDPAGNRIPGAPDRVASFGVTLTDLGPWSAGAQLRYFGPRPLIEDNSVRSSSTTLVYARAGYQINRNLKVGLDVFNLLDRKNSDIDYFYTSRLPGEAAEGVDDTHFHPVESRSFRLTLTAHF